MNQLDHVANGHSNHQAQSAASPSVKLEAAKTSNLDRVHLIPDVVRIMSCNDVTDRMTLWLEPRLLFRADRALEPSGLEHWATLANGRPRLVVRSSADASMFDTILFNVQQMDDRTDRVIAWIRDWRTFATDYDVEKQRDGVIFYDHLPPETAEFPCLVGSDGIIRFVPANLAERDERAPPADHMYAVLTWFGNLIADPSAFEFNDLSDDDDLWA
jgi:hypothetical protein